MGSISSIIQFTRSCCNFLEICSWRMWNLNITWWRNHMVNLTSYGKLQMGPHCKF